MITDKTTVKILARIPDATGEGEPTTAGEVGDIYLDVDTGLTYEWDGEAWVEDTEFDDIINLHLLRVELDYLKIRGIPYDTLDNDPVYPEGSKVVAAEMVCYLAGLGDYEGRGKASEALAGRSLSYDAKIYGYPAGIVGSIERYARVK